MKKRLVLTAIFLVASASLLSTSSRGDFPLLKGPYLGQPPPGTEPVPFAPGIISTGLAELNSVFTPDGRQIPLPTQKEFIAAYSEVQSAVRRAAVASQPLEPRAVADGPATSTSCVCPEPVRRGTPSGSTSASSAWGCLLSRSSAASSRAAGG